MKKIVAILLIACMLVTVFVACKKDNAKDPSNSAKPSSNPSTNVPDGGDDGEITNISFWVADSGNNGSGSKVGMVEDAINEIMEADYGIHVDFKWVSNADYGVQINLAIANKESVDVAVYTPNPAMSWLTEYSNGAMLDLSALLDSHGQDLKALLGQELIDANRVGDAIYGLSNYRQLDSSIYLYYREDVLEKTGTLDMYQNLSSWSEFEEFLSILTNSDIGMYAIGGAGEEPVLYRGFEYTTDSFDSITTWDMLGDNLGIIWSDQNGNVENAFARESIEEQFKMIAGWNANGHIYPDSAFSTNDSASSLIGQGVFAGGTCMSEFGVDSTKSQQAGVSIIAVGIADNFISTMNCHYFGMYIPVTSEEPEAAMTFLNALYTRADLMNLLDWGVEGETYVVKDGVGYYPDGTDVSTCGYHTNDFLMANQFLAIPWEGSTGGAEFRNMAHEKFLNAPKSVYLGLTVDTAGYDTLVSTLTAIRGEYYLQFANGMYSEAMYDEFLSKLESGNVAQFIQLHQDAVTEFMK